MHSPVSDDFVPNKGERCWYPEKFILNLFLCGGMNTGHITQTGQWGGAHGILARTLDREQQGRQEGAGSGHNLHTLSADLSGGGEGRHGRYT